MIQQTMYLRRDTTAPCRMRPSKSGAEGRRPLKKKPRIRYPHCGWQPDGKPYWQCERCFTVFDTFTTRAHCPNRACANTWPNTQCIRCGILSPHEQCYANAE